MNKQLVYQSVFSTLIILLFFQACTNPKAYNEAKEQKEPVLIWSDEFDKDGLPDNTKWSYDYGDGCPHLCGWGNNELQFYTKERPENAKVENGTLIIEARRDSFGTKAYSSARLVSKNKGDWKYGRVEVKAKLPGGAGTWAAIWMLPTENKYGNWPRSGEIDIMEHVGHESDSIFGTIHTEAFNHMIGTHRGGQIPEASSETSFHTYSIEWTADKIDFFLDDQNYFSFPNENTNSKAWPFDQKFHLIMNIAVGGTWGGEKGVDEQIWPQKMEIDYVRVYKL